MDRDPRNARVAAAGGSVVARAAERHPQARRRPISGHNGHNGHMGHAGIWLGGRHMKAKTLEPITHVTVAQAATLIGVSTRTVRRWCRSGAIAAQRGVSRGRYLVDVVEMRARLVASS